jgi:hypothetical protein
MLTIRTLPAILATAVLLAACGAAAGPSPTPEATARPTPTAVPGQGGTGGGSGGGSGGGAVAPPPGGLVDPGRGFDPILGQPHVVTPTPNLVNRHPINVQLVRAVAGADGVTAELRWWSGIAPCNALDSVEIDKDENAKSIRFTVIEGSAPVEQACIDIAELKATVVDLGGLATGTWTISAAGDAPAVKVEVA